MAKRATNTPSDTTPAKKRATELPTVSCQVNSATRYKFRDFLTKCGRFERRHKDVQNLLVDISITKLKSPSVPINSASSEWIESTLKASTRFCTDVIFYDAERHPFLFYVRQSLPPSDILALTIATKKFCTLQNPHAKTNADAAKRYKRPPHASPTPGFYDLTSVELGHGSRGIQLSQEILQNNASVDYYSDFNTASMPALEAASFMYHYLSQVRYKGGSVNVDEAQNRHADFIDLANITYQKFRTVTALFSSCWEGPGVLSPNAD